MHEYTLVGVYVCMYFVCMYICNYVLCVYENSIMYVCSILSATNHKRDNSLQLLLFISTVETIPSVPVRVHTMVSKTNVVCK